jgi:hypothetical protein
MKEIKSAFVKFVNNILSGKTVEENSFVEETLCMQPKPDKNTSRNKEKKLN